MKVNKEFIAVVSEISKIGSQCVISDETYLTDESKSIALRVFFDEVIKLEKDFPIINLPKFAGILKKYPDSEIKVTESLLKISSKNVKFAFPLGNSEFIIDKNIHRIFESIEGKPAPFVTVFDKNFKSEVIKNASFIANVEYVRFKADAKNDKLRVILQTNSDFESTVETAEIEYPMNKEDYEDQNADMDIIIPFNAFQLIPAIDFNLYFLYSEKSSSYRVFLMNDLMEIIITSSNYEGIVND